MVSPAAGRHQDGTTPPARRPFVLAPFRGLRFDPDRVGDLGTVISPPYDVLDAETVRQLEASNRRNVVRLILSRRFERPYRAVRDRLEKWRERAYLRADDERSLYLYQYTVDRVTVRGLVGLVALREASERVILPHEEVMPGPVEDRTVLMRTTQTNLEPILLVHEGTPQQQRLLADLARRKPQVSFHGLDGSEHSIWQIAEPDVIETVASQLRDAQVLIADGHHRYAAYLNLQRDMARGGGEPDGESAWDFGLAMLVDQRDYPLSVGPVHRFVAAMTLADVHERSLEVGDRFWTYPDRETAFAALAEHGHDARWAWFVVSDGRSWALLSTLRTHPIDTAVLHERVFEAWNVNEEQVDYYHRLDQALHSTDQEPGVVVAVRAPSVSQVIETAARGLRMPRKSTSFAPKPRMGVIMRDLRDH